MPEDLPQPQPLIEADAVRWWSWRPGARPGRALILGGLLSLLGLFLLLNGLLAVVTTVLDRNSQPVRLAGIVTAHSQNLLGSPQLTLRLQQDGTSATVTLVVTSATSAALANGSQVLVEYAPHQRLAFALESRGRSYPLPGSNTFWSTLGLLLAGLLLLPYPALLLFWGWRDLHSGRAIRDTGTVAALRQARQTTTRTPGLLPRTTHIWHGIAVQFDQASAGPAKILTFAIPQEQYAGLQRGTRVEVTYSPHLHHLYTLKHLA